MREISYGEGSTQQYNNLLCQYSLGLHCRGAIPKASVRSWGRDLVVWNTRLFSTEVQRGEHVVPVQGVRTRGLEILEGTHYPWTDYISGGDTQS